MGSRSAAARLFLVSEETAAAILVALADSDDALAPLIHDPDAYAARLASADASAALADSPDIPAAALAVLDAAAAWRDALRREAAEHSRWRESGAAEGWREAREARKAALRLLGASLGVSEELARLT